VTGLQSLVGDQDLRLAARGAEPLVVSPRQACRLLSVGLTRLYELLKAGKLDSFLVGRSRRITLASIHAYVELHTCREPTRIENRRAGSVGVRPAVASFESALADTAVSMSKVVESMTDSVMRAIACEMSTLGCEGDSGNDRALREAVYAVVTRNTVEAAVQKIDKRRT
jgi:excisionase family DNA binding protein